MSSLQRPCKATERSVTTEGENQPSAPVQARGESQTDGVTQNELTNFYLRDSWRLNQRARIRAAAGSSENGRKWRTEQEFLQRTSLPCLPATLPFSALRSVFWPVVLLTPSANPRAHNSEVRLQIGVRTALNKQGTSKKASLNMASVPLPSDTQPRLHRQ